ncbi:MAG: GAF domain-containing protein, partial [Myxococcota bacterium]
MTDTEVQRKLSYYRRQLDAVAGENLRKDYEISGLRKEIRYRVRAFALLSELQERVAAHRDIGEILRTVMTSITASLGMDRTVIFRPGDAEHEFRPWFWTGFTEEGRAEEFNERLEGFSVAVPELEDRSAALLVNRDSEATPSVDALQTILEMPFFVGVPVFVDDEPIALILSGRVKETGTVFAQISESDVETFRAITSLVSAVVQNIRVAALEE